MVVVGAVVVVTLGGKIVKSSAFKDINGMKKNYKHFKPHPVYLPFMTFKV